MREIAKKGRLMENRWTSFLTCTFWLFFMSFLAVHYAYVKTPGQYREIASSHYHAKPWYDASFKL
jgi:hypothetical protein